MTLKLVLATLLLALSSPMALAQPQGPAPGPGPGPGYGPGYGPGPGGAPLNPPGYHEHDGLFFRTFVGAAGVAFSAEQGADDFTISGSGPAFALAIGAAVSPRLVVYLEVFDDFADEPDLTVNGDTSRAPEGTSAGVIGVGPGLLYYTPTNFFVGGTLAFAALSLQEDGQEVAESDTGLGVSVMAGKEWWVSDNWALGGALQLFAGSMPDSDDSDLQWSASAFALLFTATYN